MSATATLERPTIGREFSLNAVKAAEYLGVSSGAFAKLVKDGLFRRRAIPRTRPLYSKADLDAFLAKHVEGPVPSIVDDQERTEPVESELSSA